MNYRAYVAEFIGTFALVWVGIYAIHHLSGVPGGLLGIALAHGLAIGLLATVAGPVSGGHFNPAVTIAMLMTRRISAVDALGYIFCQVAAGFVAAFAICAVPMFDAATLIEGKTIVANGTPTFQQVLIGPETNEARVAYSTWMLEAVATFFLMFVILGTAVDKRAPKVGGWYIGMAVTMGILAIGPLTGAAMNPARWFGPDIIGEVWMDNGRSLKWLAVGYVLGPVTGAVLAGFVHQLFMVSKEQLVEEAG
jgi:aquaporin TIP